MHSNRFFSIFWTTALSFGLVTAVMGLVEGRSVGPALVVGLICGVSFGVLMASILTPVHRWSLRQRGFDPDAEDPGVDVHEAVALRLPPEQALARCRAALEQMRASEVRADSASVTVRGRSRAGWASWGERIECRVQPADGGSRVEIRSRPWLRTTIVDYGQNRQNVERIRAFLADHAAARPVSHA